MDISSFCSKHGLRLNTNLGQHFLVNEEILHAIIEEADIHETDTILEIGPGIGVLTKELLKATKDVITIEIDDTLIPLLRIFVEHNKNLTIIHDNALQVPFPETPYKIVANIPYHITSPLLRHAFLESKVHPTTMTLLIQREVAEKICDTKDHGLLTILVGLFGSPRIVTNVPPESFLPPPKVESAVLHIDCFTEPLTDTQTTEEIFRLTKIAFSKKRKMLRNSIGELEGGMEKLAQAEIDPTRRPQMLSVQEWIRLAQT